MKEEYDPEYNGVEQVTVSTFELRKLHAQLSAYKGRIKNLEPNISGATLETYKNLIKENRDLNYSIGSYVKTQNMLSTNLKQANTEILKLQKEIVSLKAKLFDQISAES